MMLNILCGVAAGMCHLSQEGIVHRYSIQRIRIDKHRDLAARNILLNAEMGAVVSDFGFARTLQEEESSGKTVSDVGPLRWMAPESLKIREYSTKSDVWSFGVTGTYPCEIFSRRWRLYWRFYRNIVASDLDHWLQCCDRISNTISLLCIILTWRSIWDPYSRQNSIRRGSAVLCCSHSSHERRVEAQSSCQLSYRIRRMYEQMLRDESYREAYVPRIVWYLTKVFCIKCICSSLYKVLLKSDKQSQKL
jgi:serine/threonine protein kinase